MQAFKFRLALAAVALLTALFAIPAHADTYELVGLGIDNTQLYGMTDTGAVVLYADWFSCGNPATGCYDTFLNGVSTGQTDVAPAAAWDFTSGACTTANLVAGPCSVTDNGRTAVLENLDPPQTSVLVEAAGGPPQLLTTALGIDGIFAINGSGDIVFDNANLDEWYEAIDLTTIADATTPEPASLLLLATGVLALGAFTALRRRPGAQL